MLVKLNKDYLLENKGIDFKKYQKEVTKNHNFIHNSNGKDDFLGFVKYPVEYDKVEVDKIINLCSKITKNNSVLVVVGIGGSYLGARAGLEFLSSFKKPKNEVIFAGYNMSATDLVNLLEKVENKELYVNIISKSGTTLEPSLTFRFLKELLVKKYGKEFYKHIIATTDKEKGLLREEATKNGYETFVVPSNIGGRYSFLTAVGLVPVCFAGYDILNILQGSKMAYDDLLSDDVDKNVAYQHAIIRYELYKQGKIVDLMVTNQTELNFFIEWNKQLFMESEGKDGKGLFIGSANFTQDLHSLGQYIQEGSKILFETVLRVKNLNKDINVQKTSDKEDHLAYLVGMPISKINDIALMSTIQAHNTGNVPVILLDIDSITDKSLGYIMYYFMKVCSMSGLLLGVNPYNQPGVEEYKKNMFKNLKEAQK